MRSHDDIINVFSMLIGHMNILDMFSKQYNGMANNRNPKQQNIQ